MDFLELSKDRYSVRKFSDAKVDREQVNLILEAGRVAPTAANRQPQRIIIIESEEGLEKFRAVSKFHFDAPLVMIVCYDTEASWKNPLDNNRDMGEVDASIVTTHMMLETHNIGLGTTWIGYFDPKLISETFNIPANIKPVAILPIGHISIASNPSSGHFQRFNIADTIISESY